MPVSIFSFTVYNNYLRLSGDVNYDNKLDDIRSLLFPLHITSFCICDALEDDAYFGAEQIIVVSASSKTAIGLAQGLQEASNTPAVVVYIYVVVVVVVVVVLLKSLQT